VLIHPDFIAIPKEICLFRWVEWVLFYTSIVKTC
jgi:hypothetical protein